MYKYRVDRQEDWYEAIQKWLNRVDRTGVLDYKPNIVSLHLVNAGIYFNTSLGVDYFNAPDEEDCALKPEYKVFKEEFGCDLEHVLLDKEAFSRYKVETPEETCEEIVLKHAGWRVVVTKEGLWYKVKDAHKEYIFNIAVNFLAFVPSAAMTYGSVSVGTDTSVYYSEKARPDKMDNGYHLVEGFSQFHGCSFDGEFKELLLRVSDWEKYEVKPQTK